MILKPGSKEAVEQGCTCPVMENRNGQGVYRLGRYIVFWHKDGCPVHHPIEASPRLEVLHPKTQLLAG